MIIINFEVTQVTSSRSKIVMRHGAPAAAAEVQNLWS